MIKRASENTLKAEYGQAIFFGSGKVAAPRVTQVVVDNVLKLFQLYCDSKQNGSVVRYML